MADVTVTLGDITLTDLEVPERMPFGGEQMLVVHKLVGGAKVIDAMGRDEAPIEWSGWILGPDAVARAQSIDAMVSGIPQTLTWSGFTYQVLVRSFNAQFERFYQIPYKIVCEVIANNTQPVTSSATPDVDQAVDDDASSSNTLVQNVGDPTLTSLMATVIALIAAA